MNQLKKITKQSFNKSIDSYSAKSGLYSSKRGSSSISQSGPKIVVKLKHKRQDSLDTWDPNSSVEDNYQMENMSNQRSHKGRNIQEISFLGVAKGSIPDSEMRSRNENSLKKLTSPFRSYMTESKQSTYEQKSSSYESKIELYKNTVSSLNYHKSGRQSSSLRRPVNKLHNMTDVQKILKYGYKAYMDGNWQPKMKIIPLNNKSFQSGKRNTSNLMTKVVKHVQIDLSGMQFKPMSISYCNTATNSYRTELGYEMRQGSQVPGMTQLRTLDVPSNQETSSTGQQKGLVELKNEIFKSDAVFYQSADKQINQSLSKARMQLTPHSFVLNEDTTQQSGKKVGGKNLFKTFFENFGRDQANQRHRRTNSLVHCAREKMIFTSQIVL